MTLLQPTHPVVVFPFQEESFTFIVSSLFPIPHKKKFDNDRDIPSRCKRAREYVPPSLQVLLSTQAFALKVRFLEIRGNASGRESDCPCFGHWKLSGEEAVVTFSSSSGLPPSLQVQRCPEGKREGFGNTARRNKRLSDQRPNVKNKVSDDEFISFSKF